MPHRQALLAALPWRPFPWSVGLSETIAPLKSVAAPMRLDDLALERARTGASAGPSAWCTELFALLNGALATELVCVLRSKRHPFTAQGIASPRIAEEFAVHALEEMGHAGRLAQRIVQLRGQPDFDPATLSQRSHAPYDDQTDLKAKLNVNLVAERVAIESYSQRIRLVGDRDPGTRRLLEDILADEQRHADELQGWLLA